MDLTAERSAGTGRFNVNAIIHDAVAGTLSRPGTRISEIMMPKAENAKATNCSIRYLAVLGAVTRPVLVRQLCQFWCKKSRGNPCKSGVFEEPPRLFRFFLLLLPASAVVIQPR